MKYFIDFEFLEGDVPLEIFGTSIPKWFIKPNNTIQPISVGIVSQDNREYYAVSKEFNLKEAWSRKEPFSVDGSNSMISMRDGYWLRDNVLEPIWKELFHKDGWNHATTSEQFTYNSLKYLVNKYGKTNKNIAEEVELFIRKGNHIDYRNDKLQNNLTKKSVAFYGYYCDYDWVVFCWLFGKMINLPKGFPQHCIDLKQELDAKDAKWYRLTPRANTTNEQYKKDYFLKRNALYSNQVSEHNSLADARWNKKLHDFLETT